MAVYISLRGLGLKDPLAGQQAYDRGMQMSPKTLQTCGGPELIGTIGWHISQIDTVLYSVKEGKPTDKFNRKIDLRTQVQELDLLLISTQRIEKVIRSFWTSEAGLTLWGNGMIKCDKETVSLAQECDSLTRCAERIETQKVVVRTPIDRENTQRITLILESKLAAVLIRIIAQYMD